MASLQRIRSPLTGKVCYRVQIRVKGRRAPFETFPKKDDAKRWAHATETAIREGKHFPHLKAMRTRFAALVSRYEQSVLKKSCAASEGAVRFKRRGAQQGMKIAR